MSSWRWFTVEQQPDGQWALIEIDQYGHHLQVISRHRTKVRAWRRHEQLKRSQFFAQFHSVAWERSP